MSLNSGRQWIYTLRKRWILVSFGRVLLFSLSVGVIFSALMQYFFHWGLAAFLISFSGVFVGLSLKYKYWEISSRAVAGFIDLHFSEVEESSSLLLKHHDNLSFVEQLQARKVNAVLLQTKQPLMVLQPLKTPLFVLLAGIIFSVMMAGIKRDSSPAALSRVSATVSPVLKIKEAVLPQIASYSIRISPPSYTGKAVRIQSQFTLIAESGARLTWQIKTSESINELAFLFNDHELVHLKPANNEKTVWSYSRLVDKPGFYQVILNGKKSDFYQMELIQDQPVVIKITSPAQQSTIDVGQPQQVNVKLDLTDDYGIADAYISATMASGKGEAVSFKEKKLPFNYSFAHQQSVHINKLIPMQELGMKPGDELYFYVSARDNHGQQSRSDMYFVSIQDTTELMSMPGIDNGISEVPEYFRSQRQLIIDTEKLLKEKAALTEAVFKTRSNDLGIDQKMLRMRYGKFLGEESENEIGGGHEEEHGHAQAGEGKFGDVSSIMDQYAHKHDNAEDATFFEPELKAQLKATLTEMWGAELRLRTYETQKALPYEYKALRLLKDLQQKSRAYVAKTTFKTSPLKMEKRLTGELQDIKTGVSKSSFVDKDDTKTVLRKTLGLLESFKTGKSKMPADRNLLLQAEKELTVNAAAAPGIYLPALKAIKKIISSRQEEKINETTIARAEKGLNTLLETLFILPVKEKSSGSPTLSKSYFNHLKNTL